MLRRVALAAIVRILAPVSCWIIMGWSRLLLRMRTRRRLLISGGWIRLLPLLRLIPSMFSAMPMRWRGRLWRLVGLKLRRIVVRLRRRIALAGRGITRLLFHIGVAATPVWGRLLIGILAIGGIWVVTLLRVVMGILLIWRLGIALLRIWLLLIRTRRSLPVAWLRPPRCGVRGTGVACHDRKIPYPCGQKSTPESRVYRIASGASTPRTANPEDITR